MKNKNLIKMTSLIGAMTVMTGCTVPFVNQGSTQPICGTVPNTSTITAQMPENFSGKQRAPEEGKNFGDKELRGLSNASLNVFYNTIKEGEGENVLLSPASLAFALTVAENGASGDTLSQMEEYTNGGIPVEDMNRLLNYTSYKLNNAEDVKWGVANSLWFNDNGTCELEDEFVRKANEFYDAEIFKKEFTPFIVNDINSWVYKKTNKMIDNVINDFSSDAMLFIVNAIAFEGEWEEQYLNEAVWEHRTFTNANGTETECVQLVSNENRYFELGEGIGFIKPYKGGEYSFVGILPDEGVSTEEYIKGLVENGEDFSEAVRNAEYGEVVVYLPEFESDYTNEEMKEIYKKMGMDLPFNKEKAEFKGIFTNDETSQVWIGKIIHKTHIEVDRQGTRAAAATVVEMDKCEACISPIDPVFINLDRPFVYAIVDNETGVPVFLGVENNMQ